MNSVPRAWTEEEFIAIARHAAAQSQSADSQSDTPAVHPVVQDATGVAPALDKRILWIAGGVLALLALSALIGSGLAIASNMRVKPPETVASQNVEIDLSYIPSDEALQEVVRTPTANPQPSPTPVAQIVGNATVVVPEGYDVLTVRNSDGLAIGHVANDDRVKVIRSIQGSDRVTIETPALTGSVARSGIRQDN